MIHPQKILGALVVASGLLAGTCNAQQPDLTPQQAGRIHVSPVAAAEAKLPADFQWAEKGSLTIAVVPGRLPLDAYAEDNATPVGSDPDIASLVAESLGLKLRFVPVAWADWPLALQSGKVDAVISNVTVTEQRKEKFDFSTYRDDLLGIYVKSDSPIKAVHEPKDVAGLRVIVGASTNQEQILLRWDAQNRAAGLPAVQVQYYDDDVVQRLAIQSGRADAYFGPNAFGAYEARDGRTRLVGTFSGGWPLTAQIAVVTRKGAGLADAITAALNAQIASGAYAKALGRWNLNSEGIGESRTNPPGLPRS
jgi:polar amino acid transport system substrate-binding protein